MSSMKIMTMLGAEEAENDVPDERIRARKDDRRTRMVGKGGKSYET